LKRFRPFFNESGRSERSFDFRGRKEEEDLGFVK